jgi:dTDP-glucose 4,6-dehydratase
VPWAGLDGARIFLTGGTGFFGAWLLEAFNAARERLGLDLRVTVLTRDVQAARRRLPHLADQPALIWLQGDVRDFQAPPGPLTHLLHAATPAVGAAALPATELLDILVAGSRRVLDLAANSGVRRALLTSSGAVYGLQPPELERVPETYPGGPDCLAPDSTYGEGKRLAEHLFALAARDTGLEAVVARCFAFLGPHLPLDRHYAAGNFIGDALAGRPIRILGDGRPFRSYLYPTDLVIWLLTMLVRGESGRAYNLGSDQGLSLAELARMLGTMTGSPVQVLGTPGPGPAPRYVPATVRAREELGLTIQVNLEDALARTLHWHRTPPLAGPETDMA